VRVIVPFEPNFCPVYSSLRSFTICYFTSTNCSNYDKGYWRYIMEMCLILLQFIHLLY